MEEEKGRDKRREEISRELEGEEERKETRGGI